jgi:hypothetical protein
MGFYECRCLITGISLREAKTVLVPIFPLNDGTYSPFALGIKGTYNRSGSIDSIEENIHTQLLLRYFIEKFTTGDYFIDDAYLNGASRITSCHPIITTENGYVVLGVENLSIVFSAHLRPPLFEEENETISSHGSQLNGKDEDFHQHPKLHDP